MKKCKFLYTKRGKGQKGATTKSTTAYAIAAAAWRPFADAAARATKWPDLATANGPRCAAATVLFAHATTGAGCATARPAATTPPANSWRLFACVAIWPTTKWAAAAKYAATTANTP